MRTISSREYAEWVEDTVCECLEDAIARAFCSIARHFDCIGDYDERERAANGAIEEFQGTFESEWRDQAIKLFEEYGMDVRPDEECW